MREVDHWEVGCQLHVRVRFVASSSCRTIGTTTTGEMIPILSEDSKA